MIYWQGISLSEPRLPLHFALSWARYRFAAKFVKNKIVLDAGCGTGEGTKFLAKAGAKKSIGLDINIQNQKNGRVEFIRGDLQKINFPDNFLDLICAFEVIEHTRNSQKVIKTFHRILKPSGILLISTPNKAVYSPDSKKPFYPYHFYEFYLTDFKELLQPFKIQKILGQDVQGKEMKLYYRWHPRRFLRKIYASLPQKIKLCILYFVFLIKRKLKTRSIDISAVYFSKNPENSRTLLAVCEKPK